MDYVYLITHTQTDMKYIGSQYHLNANPEDIGTKYFTSSKNLTFVDDFKTNTGNYLIEILHIGKDARDIELSVLKSIPKDERKNYFNKKFSLKAPPVLHGNIHNRGRKWSDDGGKRKSEMSERFAGREMTDRQLAALRERNTKYHPMKDPEIKARHLAAMQTRSKVATGSHPSQIKVSCVFCKKITHKMSLNRHHHNCKYETN